MGKIVVNVVKTTSGNSGNFNSCTDDKALEDSKQLPVLFIHTYVIFALSTLSICFLIKVFLFDLSNIYDRSSVNCISVLH